MTDYEKAKINACSIRQYYLGQEVQTKIGKGIIVSLSMECNGLYISPERSKCTVWFGTEGNKEGFVQMEFRLLEIDYI
jgi:hypothetical protein